MEVRCVDGDEYHWDDPQCGFGQGRGQVPARARFRWGFDEESRLLAVKRHFDGGLGIKIGSQTPMSKFLNGTARSPPAGQGGTEDRELVTCKELDVRRIIKPIVRGTYRNAARD